MLKSISIKNYALINSLNIEFSKGFTVISGETGAGKSILLGALGLILGKKASTQVLLDKERKCVVEAYFDISNFDLEKIFIENDIDYTDGDDILILRREILPNAKSRAFVNDTPVNANILKEISINLIDIHSQYETLTLNKANFQLDLVDSYISDIEVLKNYTLLYFKYKEVEKNLNDLKEIQTNFLSERDYTQFLYDELHSLKLKVGEKEELEQSLSILENSVLLKETLSEAVSVLKDSDYSLISSLDNIYNKLRKVAIYHKDLEQVLPRLSSSILEIKDISSEVDSFSNNLYADNDNKELYEERLSDIYRLEAKHKAKSVEDLLEIQAKLEEQLTESVSLGEGIITLEKEKVELEKTLEEYALILHELRTEAATNLEKGILSSLSNLAMSNSRLNIKLEKIKDFNKNGKTSVKILFNANKGGELSEINKVASGGELSRLMLAIKSVIHSNNILGSIIFDEIDTGVSGEIAAKLALMLKKMSNCMQVISITHLPQVAAKADEHIRVFKQEEEGKTVSKLRVLDSEEHLETIALMISNGVLSKASLLAAQELIG